MLTGTIERSIEDGERCRCVRSFPVLTDALVLQLCTTTFLIEVSQYIKFGDLTPRSTNMSADVDSCTPANVDVPNGFSLTSLSEVRIDVEFSDDLSLSKDEEDVLLRESTADFPDWIANFIRRVILLFDNLPEEAGGATEGKWRVFHYLSAKTSPLFSVQLVDAVTNACSQICIHLSDPLFDLVLNMIFDYASNNVRPNAVRAVHQLVECVANAHPVKTLAKFVPFCINNIEVELENGASSTRTTSTFSTPLPSDATFHWSTDTLFRFCSY